MIYFRRRQFYGSSRYTEPKWHIHPGNYPGDWHQFVAACGYTQQNVLGNLVTSRTTEPKPARLVCRKCLAKLVNAAPVS